MRYHTRKLKEFCCQVMRSAGLPEEDSRAFADSLVNADMRGVASHGVTRLKTYYQRVKDRLVDPEAMPQVVSDTPAFLLVDGKNAMGVSSARYTMDLCVQRARENGCCFAAVKGGNHFGYAAYFAEMAARQGMIGVAMANGPAAIAPTGGREPLLGTNPLAVAIPAGESGPLVLDMATSVVARGKITLARKEGRPIPEGWAIDASGTPTTNPADVACVLPFGGAKGYGIALIIEILCSCLSGAQNGQTMGAFYDFSGSQQDSGFFLGALNVGGVMDGGLFGERVDGLFRSIKSSPRAQGCGEIFIPGEIEARRYREAAEQGIEISPAVLRELNELSELCCIPFHCVQELSRGPAAD